MNMDKEKVIDKVKKLLALSKSSNEHEASLALENANKLLMKHNLEMSDISDVEKSAIIEEAVMSAGRIMKWKTVLLASVMRLNNCEIITHSIRGGEKKVISIGKKQNIEVSLSMYDYLCRTMERKLNRENPYNKQSFRIGFAITINKKIQEIIAERNRKKDDFATACTALVVQEKAEVKKFMMDKYRNLRTERSNISCSDASSYSAGVRAGQATSLNSQIR